MGKGLLRLGAEKQLHSSALPHLFSPLESCQMFSSVSGLSSVIGNFLVIPVQRAKPHLRETGYWQASVWVIEPICKIMTKVFFSRNLNTRRETKNVKRTDLSSGHLLTWTQVSAVALTQRESEILYRSQQEEMVPCMDSSSSPTSWVRCFSSLSPLTVSRTILWWPLLVGSVNKSQSQELRASCYCKQGTQSSSSWGLSQLVHRKNDHREENEPVCLWRLSYIVLSYIKNYLFPKIAGRFCDLQNLNSVPAAGFTVLLVSSTCCLPFGFSLFFICSIPGWRTRMFLITLTSG